MLKKALECQICKELPLAPIYTCSSGHTICGKCRSDKRCGICNEDLTNTARNITLELIVANSSFWCRNLSDGCPKTVKGSEYREHLANCDYRWVGQLYICIIYMIFVHLKILMSRRIHCFELENKKCMGEQVRFKDYFKHLKEVHDIQGFPMPVATLTMSEYSNCLASGKNIVFQGIMFNWNE